MKRLIKIVVLSVILGIAVWMGGCSPKAAPAKGGRQESQMISSSDNEEEDTKTEAIVKEGRDDEALKVMGGYASYMEWSDDDYQKADDDEKFKAATAAILYQGFKDKGKLTISDVESGKTYAKSNKEEVNRFAGVIFSEAGEFKLTLREMMDHGDSLNQTLSPTDKDEDIDVFEFTPYLYDTAQMYIDGDQDEKDRMMTAAILYAVKYRFNKEITQKDGDILLNQMKGAKVDDADEVMDSHALEVLVNSLDQYFRLNKGTIYDLMNNEEGAK